MFGGSKPVSQDSPVIRDVKFTGSSFGKPIPIVYGRHRVPGNFIYVGGFQPVQFKGDGPINVTRAGFGGRSPKSQSYVYYVDFLCAICEGPVQEVRVVFKDSFYATNITNTLMALGAIPKEDNPAYDPVTGGINLDWFANIEIDLSKIWQEEVRLNKTLPSPNLPYPFIAYCARMQSPLGNEASLPQYNFEVISAINDPLATDEHDLLTRGANPADIVRDLLTNPIHGSGFPADHIGDLSAFEAYCAAEGFFLSLVVSEKRAAAEVLQGIATATNSEIGWVSHGLLTFIPRSDEARYDRARHLLYRPSFVTDEGDIQPLFNLTEDDFLGGAGDDIIRIARKSISDSLANYDIEYTQRNVAGEANKLIQPDSNPQEWAMWFVDQGAGFGHIYTNNFRMLYRDSKPSASLRPSQGIQLDGSKKFREARFMIGDVVDIVDTTNGSNRNGLVVVHDILTGNLQNPDGTFTQIGTVDNLAANGGNPTLFMRVKYADPANPFTGSPTTATPTYVGGLRLRAPMYQTAVVDHKNDAFIEAFGISNTESLQVPEVTDAATAKKLATLMTIRSTTILNTYEFRLDWRYVLLEPMDIVTLTYPRMCLNALPVRIQSIEEDDEGALTVVAEDFTLGVATAPLYNTQLPMPSLPDFSVDGGRMYTPLLFEPTALLTGGGIEVWIAVQGESRFWGGTDVYVSEDAGVSYQWLGHIEKGAILGTLPLPMVTGGVQTTYESGIVRLFDETSELLVSLNQPENTLIDVEDQTPADAREFRKAFYIDGGSDDYLPYEIVSYENAEPASPTTISMTRLYRGGFSTPEQDHKGGSRVFGLDRNIVLRHAIPDRCVGKTLKYKFSSQNIFGTASTDWDSALVIDYKVVGYLYSAPLASVTDLSVSFSDHIKAFTLSWVAVRDPRAVEYEVRKGTAWLSASIVAVTTGTSIVIVGDGSYWVAPRVRIPQFAQRENDLRPKGYVYGEPATLYVTGTETFPGNVVQEYDEFSTQFGNYDAQVRAEPNLLAFWNRMSAIAPRRAPYVFDEISQASAGQYIGSGITLRQQGAVLNDFENAAVDLNGTASVELAPYDALRLDDGDWAMSIWFKTSSLSAAGLYLYSRGDNSYIGLWTGRIFWKKDNAGSFYFLGETPGTGGLGYADGLWHNLVVSYYAAGQELSFFVDGRIRGTIKNMPMDSTDVGDTVYLGQKGDSTGIWPDLIDDFVMFNRRLAGPTAQSFYKIAQRDYALTYDDPEEVPPRTYEDFVTAAGALFYVKLAEVESTKLADVSEPVSGVALNTFDGTITGTPGFVAGLIANNPDGGVELNGSTYVTHPWVAPNNGDDWDSLTFECLFRVTTMQSAGIVQIGSASGDDFGLTVALSAAGGLAAQVQYTGGGGPTTVTLPAGTFVIDTTYHLAVVLGQGFVRVYVDGELEAEVAASDDTIKMHGVGDFSLTLGRAFTGGAWRYFIGVLDECAVYEGYLEVERIQAHAQSALGGRGLQNMYVDPKTGHLRVLPGQTGYYHVPAAHIVEISEDKHVTITAEWDLNALLPENVDVISNFDLLGTVDTQAIKGGRSSGAAVLMDGYPEVRSMVNGIWGAWRRLIPAQYHGSQFDVRFRLSSFAIGVVAELVSFIWRVDVPDLVQRGEISAEAAELDETKSVKFNKVTNVSETGVEQTSILFEVIFAKPYSTEGKPQLVVSANGPVYVKLDPLVTDVNGVYSRFSGRVELIAPTYDLGHNEDAPGIPENHSHYDLDAVVVNWIATGY